jgi:hypothetical protein
MCYIHTLNEHDRFNCRSDVIVVIGACKCMFIVCSHILTRASNTSFLQILTGDSAYRGIES